MRSRRHAHLLVAATSWVSRLITGFISIFRIRLLVEGLGTEGYAAFALLNSLQGWFALSDFGLGAALQNSMSERRAQGRSYADYIAFAVRWVVVCALVFGIGIVALSPWLGALYLHASVLLADERAPAFALTGVTFVVATIGGVAYRIWYAQQRGYLSNAAPAVAAMFSLGCIAWVTAGEAGEANFMACLVAGVVPAAAVALASFVFVSARIIRSAPAGEPLTLGAEDRVRLKIRARDFFLLAVLNTAVLNTDYIVMSQFLGSQDIVTYNLTTRIFDTFRMLYGVVLLALWPTCTELIKNNDWPGVYRHLRVYIGVGIAFIVCFSLAMVPSMSLIVTVLAPGQDITVPTGFILLCGAFEVVRTWTNTFGMVLFAMSKVRVFWFMLPIQAALTVGAQALMAPAFGFYGITAGMLLGFVATGAWLLPLTVHRLSRASHR